MFQSKGLNPERLQDTLNRNPNPVHMWPTVALAAKLLRLTPAEVRRLIKDGKLKTEQYAGRIRIDPCSVLKVAGEQIRQFLEAEVFINEANHG